MKTMTLYKVEKQEEEGFSFSCKIFWENFCINFTLHLNLYKDTYELFMNKKKFHFIFVISIDI